MTPEDKLLKALKEQRLVFGAKAAQKLLLAENADEIFLAVNCPNSIREKIKSVANSKISVTELPRNSEELGTLCKKPFSIAVAAIKKTKE